MFTIAHIDHIVLRTSQIEKMVQFYCDVLNCHIERVQAQFGLTQLRAGKNIIDLIKVDSTSAKENQNLEHFCLRISPFNFEELSQYFNKKGIEIFRHGQRYSAQGYGWSFYLRDPENNEIELAE
jgi:glyoxylase I family protein